jgi:hypothetical protein
VCHHPKLEEGRTASDFGHGVSEEIGRMKNYLLPLVAVLLAASPWAKGDIVVSLGNTSSSLVNGAVATTTAVNTAQSGQLAPFTGNCGNDASANCVASWTLPSSSLAGQTVTGATLTLGIWDIDSGAPGLQVGSYGVSGVDDLTTLLNNAAEGLNGGTGAVNSEYDVLSVVIPDFALFDGTTSATISLALQGPGLGVLSPGTNPAFNGAKLVYSTLDLQTTPLTATPEPALLPLLIGGMGAIVLARKLRKRSKANIIVQSL